MSTIHETRWTALGAAIRSAREGRGWLQGTLARQLGVGQQTVSRWEKGISRPEPSTMSGLAGLLPDQSLEEWNTLAGYAQKRSPRRTQAIANPALLPSLPFAMLPHERFEDFCRDMLAARHPKAQVNRFGRQGDRQEGIDIEVVFPRGDRHVYQNKRHKKFGKKKVTAAVKALKDTKASLAVILLSRVASAEARKAVRRYPKWQLWDCDYISRVVRQDLRLEQQLQLVDTYFPGLRQAFLGISDPSPFLTPEQYFGPLLKHTIFSHGWHLVGRKDSFAQLTGIVARDPRSTAMLVGSGGIGKSRVIREVCEQFEKARPDVLVRIIDASANLEPKHFDLLRGGEILLVVDDAHDRTDLNLICNLVARSLDPIRLLLITRPFAKSIVTVELTRAGISLEEDAIVALKRLGRDDVEALALEVLTTMGGPKQAAPDIARATADSPLATVVGSYLLATKKITPALLASEEAFRHQLYKSFEEAITGEISKTDSAALVSDTLGLAAVLQPIDLNDPAFRSVAEQILGQPIDKILRALTRLQEAGVLIKRGRRLRIIPDLLGEYILEDRCATSVMNGSSGFAERVAALVNGEQLGALIANFSKLDWRLSRAAVAAGGVIEPLWQSLMESYERDPASRLGIAKAISDAAYYQPVRALRFADRIKPGDVKELSSLLRNVAYNYEYVREASDRLWQLGRDDARQLHQHPSHPIRILCELAEIAPGKPLAYCEAIIDFAIDEVGKPSAISHAYSPFDILEAGLKTEGHTSEPRGLSISFKPFTVRAQAVRHLRKKILDTLFRSMCQGRIRVAVRAARALGDGLRAPIGLMGSNPTKAEKSTWTPEFVDTINRVGQILGAASVDPAVSVELQRAISWHTNYASGPTRVAAQKAVAAIPSTLMYRTTLNLLDGWGHIRERIDDDDHGRAQLHEEMKRTARELVAAYPKSDDLRKVLEERLTTIRKAGANDESSAQVFLAQVLEEAPGLRKSIWASALAEDAAYPLLNSLSTALGQLIDESPEEALAISRRALDTGVPELSRAVAVAYGWRTGRARAPSEVELQLIAELLAHDDACTASGVTRALELVAVHDQAKALQFFISIDFQKHPRVVHDAFLVFLTNEHLKIDSLNVETLDKILAKLLPVPEIEDHWLTKFLTKASSRFPGQILQFLLHRMEFEHTEAKKGRHGYDAIPWRWQGEAKLAFRDTPKFAEHLRAIVTWAKKLGNQRSNRDLGVLCAAVCAGYDTATLDALSPFLFSADPKDVEVAALLLRGAPRSFVFEHAPFVVRLLEHAHSFGGPTSESIADDLAYPTLVGTRHGTPGQPFPEDIELRDRSAAHLSKLSRSSPAWEFYARLKERAEYDIKRRDRLDIDDEDEDA